MTDLLCAWMNDDVGLSQRAERTSFATQFANGYYFAEVLAKSNLLVRCSAVLFGLCLFVCVFVCLCVFCFLFFF